MLPAMNITSTGPADCPRPSISLVTPPPTLVVYGRGAEIDIVARLTFPPDPPPPAGCVFAIPQHGFVVAWDTRTATAPKLDSITPADVPTVRDTYGLQLKGGSDVGCVLRDIIPGSHVIVLHLLAIDPDSPTGINVLQTLFATFTLVPWLPSGPDGMPFRPDLHTMFLADVEGLVPSYPTLPPSQQQEQQQQQDSASPPPPPSSVVSSHCSTVCGRPGVDAQLVRLECATCQHRQPHASSWNISSVSPHRPRGVADPDAPPTVRVTFIGDGQTFDGMKTHIAEQIRRFAAFNVQAVYMNTVCNTDDGTTMRYLHEAGAEVINMCIAVPRTICPNEHAYFEFVTSILPRVRHYTDLPDNWRDAYAEIASVFARSDALTVGLFWPPDVYFLVLAKLVNPTLVQYLDIGSQYIFSTPEDDNLGVSSSVETETTCAYPPSAIARLAPEMGPKPPSKYPILPFPAQYFIPPSQWVRNQPDVVAAGIPARAVYPFVNAALNDPNVYRCPGGVRPDFGQPDTDTDPNTGVLVFGNVGRIAPEKNVGMLLLAFAEVVKRYNADPVGRRPHLMLVGKPANPLYEVGLRQMTEAAGVPRHMISWVGFVKPEQVPAYLACMDVYVSPSIKETFGIAAVQAMAMRRPLVHFGAGGQQDYTRDMENALHVKEFTVAAMADGMQVLAADPDLRVRLGQAARQFVLTHVSSFAIGALSAKTYRSTIGEKRLDGATRFSVVVAAAAAAAEVGQGIELVLSGSASPRVDTASDVTLPHACRRFAWDTGAEGFKDGEPTGFNVSGVTVAVAVESPSDAFAVFGTSPRYVTNDYAAVFDKAITSPSDLHHRLFKVRHRESLLCAAVCPPVGVQHLLHHPACVPFHDAVTTDGDVMLSVRVKMGDEVARQPNSGLWMWVAHKQTLLVEPQRVMQ